MPVNPNIALGAQAPAPVNFLGQMGQMLALKGAAQEIEGSEGVRNALKEGAPEDPTALLQYGKQGRATYESLLKGRKEQLESTVKKIGITSSAFKVIEENPTIETAQKVFGDLVGMGAMDRRAAEGALAKVTANPTPDNIRTLARQGIEYGISAAERLTAQTRLQAANISAGPGYQQAALAREKFNLEQQQQTDVANMLRGGGVPATGTAPAPVNALVAPSATASAGDVYSQISDIDNKITQLVNSGNPKAVAYAQVLNSQRTQLLQSAKQQYGGNLVDVEIPDPADPTRKVTIKGRVDQYGRVAPAEISQPPLSVDASATGGTTLNPNVVSPAPTTEVLKQRQTIEKLPTAIAQSKDTLKLIDRMVGAPGGKSKPHEGFSGAVGAGMGMRFIPGTSASDFQAMHEQVTGGAFLQAFNDLKGGGAITEKEGEKATAAITRMKLSTSEKEYIQAAREFQDVVRRGIETAEKKVRPSGAAPASTGGVIDFGSLK